MKRNKEKGFTLIELLAVIVILAIIALITVPIILNVIYKAEKGAFEDAAYGVIDAGRLHFTESLADTNSFTGKTFDFGTKDHGLKISGEKPGGGTLVLDGEGNQTLAVYDTKKRWCALKGKEEHKVKIGDYKGSSCDEGVKPTPTPGEEIPITENKTIYIPKGGTALLKITGATKYTSSNTSIATVDGTGYVKVPGSIESGSTSDITVDAPGKVITVKVIVTPKIEGGFYMIYNKVDIEWFGNETNAKTIPVKNAKLMNDIDLLGNESNQWIPITDFQGTFDGQSHSIKNLYINKPNIYYQALFYLVGPTGTVKNTTVEGAITAKKFAAGISVFSSGVIENCINKATIRATISHGGGVVAEMGAGIVRNNKNYGTVTCQESSCGGIMTGVTSKRILSIIDGNENYGTVNAPYGPSGIIAVAWEAENVSIENNKNKGQVVGNEAVSGIASDIYGSNNIVFKNNQNTVPINASNKVGGIVAWIRSGSTNITLTGNSNTGNITGSVYVGQIVGLNQGSSVTIN